MFVEYFYKQNYYNQNIRLQNVAPISFHAQIVLDKIALSVHISMVSSGELKPSLLINYLRCEQRRR